MDKEEKSSPEYLFKEYKRLSRLSKLFNKKLVGKHSEVHKMVSIITSDINKNLDRLNASNEKRDGRYFYVFLFDNKKIIYRLTNYDTVVLDSKSTHLIYLYINNNYKSLTYFECISFIIFVLRYNITEHTELDAVDFG
jgi:hypothetical protein